MNIAFFISDTDECAGNPCINGGTCTDQVNTYTCSCVAGYVGTHCETGTISKYTRTDYNNASLKQMHSERRKQPLLFGIIVFFIIHIQRMQI